MSGGNGNGGSNGVGGASAEVRLRGWKEIGRHFGVDERTVKRWEAQRGLPVHRVPGEPRAPVFAYIGELRAWENGKGGEAAETIVPAPSATATAPDRTTRALPRAILALLVLLAGLSVWLGLRAVDGRREAAARTEELARLATMQVATLNDQLGGQPGTVAVRAGLAREAMQVLGQVAAMPDASARLRQDAAEGYRRLAVLQNAIDRPSLRDRAAARTSLARALALLEDDTSAAAALVRARAQIESAEQASADGKPDEAARLLAAARPVAFGAGAGELAGPWWLADSARAGWKGDMAASAAAARQVRADGPPVDVASYLLQVRARDLEAEALYYQKDLAGAEALYRQALTAAEAGLNRWPQDSRAHWTVLRQRWNLGATMTESGHPRMAVPILAQSLEGWERLAAADPTDAAVQAWVHAVRLSLGEALARSGDHASAIAELSRSVAERRAWHAERPGDADRRRMLVKAAVALSGELVHTGRSAEACALQREVQGLLGAMATDGQLTGFDRAETVAPVETIVRAHC